MPAQVELDSPDPSVRQTASVVAPTAAAPDAAPDEPPAVAATPLERSLDSIADSFLTEEPDVVGLLSLSSALAGAASVVPGSLQGEKAGHASGKLDVGGNLKGTFSIDEREYRVDFDTGYTRAPFRRTLSVRFTDGTDALSGAQATVESFPNKAASPSMGNRELLGWRVSIDPVDGAQVCRRATKVEDLNPSSNSYLFEVSDVRGEPRAMPWIANTDAFDPWLQRLRPLRSR